METILVATDFSKPANGAVEYAAHLARFLNSKLIIIHAFKLPLGGYDMGAPLVTIADIRSDAMQQLELIRLELIRGSYDPGITLHAGLGTTTNVIRDAAYTYGAELIVMGMTGESGKIKQHLIGSNTLQVAREIPLPVLVIPEHASYKPVHNICLAAELQGLEKSSLLYAARDAAKLFGASLEIVTVEPGAEDTVEQNAEAYSFIEKKLHDMKHTQVLLREDNTSLALEYYFKFHETDLVIVNPRKHKFFTDMFSGSITRHLAFHVRVPLLILH